MNAIKVLIEKGLLFETKDHRLDMHNVLEDLGRSIVHQESPNNVGERSRLWKLQDIKEVLENNTGSKAIQAIVMKDHYGDLDKIEVHPQAFSKMSNIELFICTGIINPFVLPRKLKLSGALKVVQWPSIPFEALPLETPLDKLAHIDMYDSKIIQLWNDKLVMENLKSIDLSYSCNLIETPNFYGIPYLKHLCLRGCKSLVKVDPSLGKLEKLVEVDLSGCVNLEMLPTKLDTKNLIKLDLSWCKKVAVVPEFGEDMKKLSYLDVSDTAITTLPESLGCLTGLRYLNLNLNLNVDKIFKTQITRQKILNVDKMFKTQITRQIPRLHVTSLTELYLRGYGLNDGSIPDDFGSLTSLIVLDLSGNDFVNLPTGCFSGLFRLVFLSLDRCERLKSLPRLPPRLVRLNASGCKSLEGLSSDGESWNFFASLDHKYREQTKYVISDDEQNDDIALMYKHVEQESLPLRDFCAIIPGRKIPSWFPNKGYYYPWDKNRREYEIKANIPLYFRESEWSGIVVCLHISGSFDGLITWSSKAAEDDYIFKQWAHFFTIRRENNQNRHLCIMILGLNEQTCWQHLKGHTNNSLHIKFSTCYELDTDEFLHSKRFEILGCGWRVICKEDIQEWCNSHNDFTRQKLAATHDDDEFDLPSRVVVNFFGKSLPPPPPRDKSSCIVM